ncbi:MAG: PDZ domain-containing protein [Planctomycetota bacterium]
MKPTKLPLWAAFACVLAPCLTAQSEKSEKNDDAWVDAFQWSCIGPANMGGRIVALAINEQDPSNYWVATASGGLLKTTNNGVTFEHQFDREAVVSIGDVAVAPSDPNVLWLGTGEGNPRNSVSYGNGIYRSADGGATWEHVGLEKSFQIGRIAVHPEDPDVAYVGALGRLYGPNEERGLYKTTDAGESWERVLFVDENTGVIDVQMHPEDPDTLLVATYERRRDGFDGNAPATKFGAGSGLWRTKDGGQTFEKLTKGLPTATLGRIGLDYYRANPDVVYAVIETELIGKAQDGAGWAGLVASDGETSARISRLAEDGPAADAGLAEGDLVVAVDGTSVVTGRQMMEQMLNRKVGEQVELQVARRGEVETVTVTLGEAPEPKEDEDEDDPRARFARRSMAPETPFSSGLGGQVANAQDFQGPGGHEHGGVFRSDDGGTTWQRINSLNPRPMYFSQLRVDPSDNNFIYVLGIRAARSTDGGKTFTSDASNGVHADQHALWIDPRDGRHMILGTDGGLYVTWDRSAQWEHLNHLALGQFYHVAVGPRRAGEYWVYGGLQDNGTWGAPRRSKRGAGPINEDWLRVGGGDGFLVQIDEEDPDQIYYESQNGGTMRTHLRTMRSARIRPPRGKRGTRYRFNWRTPFILSHHNSRIYYNAGNHVFRSLDRGDDLKVISPEITRGDRGSATALAESPHDADVLYVGTDDGALWMTKNGGADWIDLWPLDPEPAESIAAGTVVATAAAVGGPRESEPPSAAEGASLADLVPGPRWVSSIEVSRSEPSRVYLTLDAHRSDDDDPYVFVSEDYGATWRSLRGNLPWGSTRVIREDLASPDLLWLGTEFGLWVSLDRGERWVRFHGNLPTVAVHEVAQHASSGDVVLGTHGRSLWVVDATALRQLGDGALEERARLYEPRSVMRWRRLHSRGSSGGAQRYVGAGSRAEASIYYSLGRRAQSVALSIRDASGKTVRELEASREAGLHRVAWDLRARPLGGASPAPGRFRGRRAQSVGVGTYTVVLEVDGEVLQESLVLELEGLEPAGGR